MSGDREKIVDRVRALLVKANDEATTKFERMSFIAGAERLITKYRIEAGELAYDGEEIEHRQFAFADLGNLKEPAAVLWAVVAEHNNCFATYTARSGRGQLELDLFGTETDQELTTFWVSYLFTQLANDVARDRPRSRKSYGLGWVDEISHLLQATRAVVESDSKALVPVNTKAEETANATFKIRGRRQQATNHDDELLGRIYGRQADIGLTSVEGGAA